MNGLGRVLIITGFILVAMGVVLSLSPRIPWLGRLPGDIYIKKENFSFYFPIATSVLVSLILSLLLWLFRR
jgi:hypothetical protein